MPEPPSSEVQLSIGQVAQRTGLSVHALRYYEREGLLPAPVRAAGRRRYTEWDLEWLDLCIKLRASGMPLSAIRRYTELVQQGAGNEADRLALLREHQQRVTAQIAQLVACQELISFKVKLYEESLAANTPDPIWTPPEAPVRPRC